MSTTLAPTPFKDPPVPADPSFPQSPGAPQEPAPKNLNLRPDRPVVHGGALWRRKWNLSIGTQAGTKARDLSQLGFRFAVQRAQNLTPSLAKITVYNLPDDVVAEMQKELTFIYLQAGYEDPGQYGVIFGGPISYYRHGRENATDTFVEVTAVEYDQELNARIINKWLPAGYTKRDVLNVVADEMGVAIGQCTTKLSDDKSPRGRVLFGMARDVLRDQSHTDDTQCWIDENGKLHVLGKDEALAMGEELVPVLNSSSGMVNIPTQTMGGGIEVTSLLNPNIKPGGQIHIDQASITQLQSVTKGQLVKTDFALNNSAESLKADGFYIVDAVNHTGENRGNSWYSNVTTKPYDITKQQFGIRPSG